MDGADKEGRQKKRQRGEEYEETNSEQKRVEEVDDRE